MKLSTIYKAFHLFVSISLVLQTFSPFLFIQTAYAEDASTSSAQVVEQTTVETTPAPETTVSPTETAPTAVVTETPTDVPAPTTEPEVTPTETPAVESTTNESAQPTAPPATDEDGSLSATILENVSAPSLDLDAFVQGQSATLTTDKPDYAPTDTAVISGNGFTANKSYSLTVSSDDAPATSTTVNVVTNEQGSFVYAYQLDGTYRPNYKVVVKDGDEVVATTTFTDAPNPATDISQCQNGGVGNPLQPCSETVPFAAASGYGYEGNAAANSGNSHWTEGDFVPLRIVATNFSAGAGYIDFSIDVTKGGKHAYDYVGSFDTTETLGATAGSHFNHNNPVTDIIAGANPASPDSTGAVPGASLNPFPVACGSNTFVGSQVPGSIKAWGTNGSLNISYVSENVGSNDCTTRVRVAWPNTKAGFGGTIVIAYGAHIAKQSDWGTGNSAINISGSPYHTSLVERSTGGDVKGIGNQDAKLSASAIILPSTITIHKVTSPNASDSTSFSFTTTGTGYSNFNLTGGTQNQQNVNPGSYSVTETVSSGWSNTGLSCTASGTGSSATPNLASHSVAITIGSGGGATIDCIYTNTLQQAHLTLVKEVTNDNGGTAAATDWTLSATGPTNISGVTGAGAVTNAAVNSGAYTLGESGGPSGYTASTYSCVKNGGAPVVSNSLTLAGGDNATCTINNNDNAAHLKVIKHVINDNGGTKEAGDFTMNVTATDPSDDSFPGAENPGTEITLDAGAYSVDEGTHVGYDKTLSANCSGTIALGETKTCTITNDDQAATLIVKKVVVNDNGGTAEADDFTFKVNGGSAVAFEADGQNDLTVNAGTYSVVEPAVAGYATTYENCSNLQIPNGGTATCTVTNDDIAPKLTLIKEVTNNNGGKAVAGDFTLTASGPTGFNGVGPSVSNGASFDAGTYDLSESGVSGYTGSAWVCVGGNQTDDDTIAVGLGDDVTCTITNDDEPGKLIVKKVVINDNGGTKNADDFTFKVNNGSPVSFEADGQNDLTVDSGEYDVVEPTVAGYATTYDNCTNVFVPNGGTATCTITNDDIQPKLTVIKHVINDNGGTASASSFSMFVNGVNASPALFGGDESGTEVALDAGSYIAGETTAHGYDASFSADCSGTIAIGETKTCTITNDDQAPALHLRKIVTNNNGGTATVDDFTLTANGTGSNDISGKSPVDSDATLQADTFALSETNVTGYSASAWSCVKNDDEAVNGSSVTIGLGDEATCTITNDDIQPKLTLIKHVVNNNGGTLGVSDFPLFVDTTGVTSGVSQGFDAGTYTASETAKTGYEASDWSGACAADGTVTLNIGDDKTCEITNDDLPAHLIVIKHVINDDGDVAAASDFTMHLTGTNLSTNDFAGSEAGVNVALNAGAYTADETNSAGYIKTLSADCSGIIANGQTKTCTITNNDRPFATRTQGFWQTHTTYTSNVFAGFGGVLSIGTKTINTTDKLFAGFYASLTKTTTNAKRSQLDQARMQMLQQWLAAKLNCKAFGCSLSTQNLLTTAATAWSGTNASLILSYASQLDAYNNSNDALPISGQGKATPQVSQTLGSSAFSFWNVLP